MTTTSELENKQVTCIAFAEEPDEGDTIDSTRVITQSVQPEEINLQITLINVRSDLAHIIPYNATIEQLSEIIKYINSAILVQNINSRKTDTYFLSCHRNSSCRPYFTLREIEQIIKSLSKYPYKDFLVNGYYVYVIGVTYDYEYEELLVPEKVFELMTNIM